MKAVVVALSLLLLGSVYGYTSDEYKGEFVRWMAEHQKSYVAEEFLNRFEIFKANMDYVREWNAQGSPTVLGLTVFADLANTEYRNVYLGTRYDGTARLANPEVFVPPTSPLADTVDWRAKGYVTPIKDQGQCGSCWSFSSTGGIEGAWFKATGNLVSLSEQNLMDCSYGQGNLACNGGLMPRAFQYVINNKGIATEESYPYTAKSAYTCHYATAKFGANITSYVQVAAGKEDALVAALNTVGPISVAIDASHNSFQLYHSGVYYESTCSSDKLDHGVLAVGYGTDDSKNDYFIVKNSWGTSWGMSGYINMARNKNNNCGIATQASYPISKV